MKILTFGDLHEDYGYAEVLERKAKHVDLIICLGDITVFGDNLEPAINFLDSLGKKVICIHGNHESESRMKKLCEKTKNVMFLHKKACLVGDVFIMCYGGGGFTKEDEEFVRFGKVFREEMKLFEKTILVTHAPPHKTKLDEMREDYHVGSKSIREFIEKAKPSVAVSGHIHETFEKVDRIGETVIVNPGPGGAIIDI